MTLTTIEKAARLMGYVVAERKPEFNYYHLDKDTVGTFDPRTNKADLTDVETELSIDIRWNKGFVMASTPAEFWYESFKHHPTKFAARAEAVLSVVSQIYDAKYGKDGE